MKNLIQDGVINFLGSSDATDASVENVVSSILAEFTGELGDWCPGLQNALIVKYSIDPNSPHILIPPSEELSPIDLSLITRSVNEAAVLARDIVTYASDPSVSAPMATAMANYFMLSDLGTYIQGAATADDLHDAILRFYEEYPLTEEMLDIVQRLTLSRGADLVVRLASFVINVGCGGGNLPETVEDMNKLATQLSTTPVTALSYFTETAGIIKDSVWSMLLGSITLQFKVLASIRDALLSGIVSVGESIAEEFRPDFVLLSSKRKPNYLPYPVEVIRVRVGDNPEILQPLARRFRLTNQICVVGRGVVFIVREDPDAPDDSFIISVHALSGAGTYNCYFDSSGYCDGVPHITMGEDKVRVYSKFWKQYNSPFGIAIKPVPQSFHGRDAKASFAGLVSDYNVMLTLGLVLARRLSAYTVGALLDSTDETLQVDIQSAFWNDWYQYLGYCDTSTGVCKTPWSVTGDSSWIRRMMTIPGVSNYEDCSSVDVAKALANAGYDAAISDYDVFEVNTLDMSTAHYSMYIARAVLMLAAGVVDFENFWTGIESSKKHAFLAFSNNWRVMRVETFLNTFDVANLATDAQQRRQLRTIGVLTGLTAGGFAIVAFGGIRWLPRLASMLIPRLFTWKSRRVSIQTADDVNRIVRLIKSSD